MNYVLIVSQPDGEKEGTSPKQFALDMGMFDFKDGREVIEEVVDEDGNTRKIIRVNPKKFEMVPSTITQLQCHYCSYTISPPWSTDVGTIVTVWKLLLFGSESLEPII
jgi:hypothetical protein